MPGAGKRELEDVARIVQSHKDRPGPLMIILHEVQETLGYVPDEAVPVIAHGLNLTRAEVHGVVTFYHDFRRTPAGRHRIKVCLAESCQAVGGAALTDFIKQRLDVELHGTTPDQAFTLEPVYCLGNCACSPALMIDDAIYGRVTPDRFSELVSTLESV